MAMEYVATTFCLGHPRMTLADFVVTKVTPDMITDLGYKIFIMFATVNIGAMGLFSMFVSFILLPYLNIHTLARRSLIPETKGRSLEEMDVIFGSISAEQRQVDIDKQEKGVKFKDCFSGNLTYSRPST